MNFSKKKNALWLFVKGKLIHDHDRPMQTLGCVQVHILHGWSHSLLKKGNLSPRALQWIHLVLPHFLLIYSVFYFSLYIAFV